MSKQNPISTANDNTPSQKHKAISYQYSIITDNKSSKFIENTPDLYTADTTIVSNNTFNFKSRSLKISIVLWIVAIAIGLSCILRQTGTELKTLSALAVLWAGLWTSYVAADHNQWRLSELSIVSALGGLMSFVMIVSNYIGLNLTLIDGIVLMSLFSVVMGHALKSRIAILASICATLLWAILSFMGLAPINNIAILFPLLTGLQIYAGSRIDSGLAIGLAIIIGYYALIGFLVSLWTNDLIPLTYAASLLFIIGIAHHRIGKAAEDSKISSSNLHIYSGWIVAMISAIIFQYLWLSFNAAASSTASISGAGLGIWKTAISISILAIFISGIIRFKHTQITLAGIFLLTLGSALIPLMTWFPNWPEALAADIPGVNAIPTFGIIIGAGIIATSLGFSLNGMRRKSYLMLFIGLPILSIEAFLLITPSFMTADNIIIFFTAFLVSLAVGGAIAGNSLAFQAPAPRLKYT